MFLVPRGVIPNEGEDVLIAFWLRQVYRGIGSHFLNDLREWLTGPDKLHLDYEFHGPKANIGTRMKLAERLQIILVHEVRKYRGQDQPEDVLDVVLIVDVPIARNRILAGRPGATFPRPAPQPRRNAAQ
jgi:hypothetical protein